MPNSDATAPVERVYPYLSLAEREQVAQILRRRSNEIADYLSKYRKNDDHFGSVELALTREIERLRRLAEKIDPAAEEG